MATRIPNLDTFSAIVDRLIIEVNKVAVLENKKREEQQKENPDAQKITDWDNASREANECRAALKRKLDELFEEAVSKGEYKALIEARTFS